MFVILVSLVISPYNWVAMSHQYPSLKACYADMSRVNNSFDRDEVESLKCQKVLQKAPKG